MRKLSGFKGLVCLRDGYDTILNDQEALILLRQSFGIAGSHFRPWSLDFPRHEGLYLMEISCPENCQTVNRQRLQSILSTYQGRKRLSYLKLPLACWLF